MNPLLAILTVLTVLTLSLANPEPLPASGGPNRVDRELGSDRPLSTKPLSTWTKVIQGHPEPHRWIT
jgi:hypothetical protein